MSGAYTIAGFLLGVMAARISFAEPGWAGLIAPAVCALIAGLIAEAQR